MIDLDLVDDFITFLREKGKVQEAEEMAITYEKFKKNMEETQKEVEEKLAMLKDTPEGDDLIANTKDGSTTLEDCDFIACAILPSGDMHIVDINPDDIRDLIADMGHFRVHEKPIGKAEPTTSFMGQKPKNKYLD